METLRCKRIIKGKTYNTETATRLGHYVRSDVPDWEWTLYKTRYGAYFELFFDGAECIINIYPLSPEDAQDWMEKWCSGDDVEAEFGNMPDAGNNEARLTIRISDSLHQRIIDLASAHQQSLNAWVTRCLEKGTRAAEGKDD